jgi:hypothetical protein
MSNKSIPPGLQASANSPLAESPLAAAGLARAASLRRRLWSRRRFLRRAAGAAGLVLGAHVLWPGLALGEHQRALPTPIPETTVLGGTPFHVVGPGPADQGNDPSVITDFKGVVGIAAGAGTGTDEDGDALTLSFDYRFMKGEYVGVDGKRHHAAFAFI